MYRYNVLRRCTRLSTLCISSGRCRVAAFCTHFARGANLVDCISVSGSSVSRRASRRRNTYLHSCGATVHPHTPVCRRFAAPEHAATGDLPSEFQSETAHLPLERIPGPAADAQHTPVLLREVLGAFEGVQLHTFVDGTLGAGGHSCAIASAHQELRTLIGIDQDETAFAIAEPRLAACSNAALDVRLRRGNFRDMQMALQSAMGDSSGIADGILLDLGVSSMQLDRADRGFSFMRDGPLDMRMGGGGAAMSAEVLVNTADEAELGRILRDWGEERAWRRIAARIARCREEKPIRTTQQLVAAIGKRQQEAAAAAGRAPSHLRKQPHDRGIRQIDPGCSGGGRGGGKGGRGIHPATRTFQALRIAVNDELGALRDALPAAIEALAPGGRLAVISFHSLEDRIVKRAFLAAAGRPQEEHAPDRQLSLLADLGPHAASPAVGRILTKRPVTADEGEQRSNPRSRSAKLRVLEKLPQGG